MIHLLWPTIRPLAMANTHGFWMSRSSNSDNIKTYVAVNNANQKDQVCRLLSIEFQNVYISGDIVGVTNACDYLTHLRELDGPDDDIVILASDDMYAPNCWDEWIVSNIKPPYMAILVNDGYIKQDNVTLPIMNMKCLKMLNRIIYHKSYVHSYSDTELYDNLKSLKVLKDLWDQSPIFEHKNWANNKRDCDIADKLIKYNVGADAENWAIRKRMSLLDRLK